MFLSHKVPVFIIAPINFPDYTASPLLNPSANTQYVPRLGNSDGGSVCLILLLLLILRRLRQISLLVLTCLLGLARLTAFRVEQPHVSILFALILRRSLLPPPRTRLILNRISVVRQPQSVILQLRAQCKRSLMRPTHSLTSKTPQS